MMAWSVDKLVTFVFGAVSGVSVTFYVMDYFQEQNYVAKEKVAEYAVNMNLHTRICGSVDSGFVKRSESLTCSTSVNTDIEVKKNYDISSIEVPTYDQMMNDLYSSDVLEPSIEVETSKYVISPTVTEILEKINQISEISPFQGNELSKSYVGVKVNWDLYLVNIVKQHNNFYLVIASPYADELKVVSFIINLEHYPKLKSYQLNTKLNVFGEIQKADSSGVSLQKVKLM
ncbi:hypothetical protein Q9F31_004719 [Vibrio alginolyticus]|nr:hypothetical protein [Vibrio alginolyticus]ELA7389572.1 hypothetical protein [Vibrio alginolyticus]